MLYTPSYWLFVNFLKSCSSSQKSELWKWTDNNTFSREEKKSSKKERPAWPFEKYLLGPSTHLLTDFVLMYATYIGSYQLYTKIDTINLVAQLHMKKKFEN